MRVRVSPSALEFMLSFFHNFEPQAIAFSFGWLTIYWYGLFLVLGIIAAMVVTSYFWQKEGLQKDQFYDLTFWLIISGLLGARIYEWFLNYSYYFSHLSELFKVWHGGLAIHGGLIGATIVLLIFSKKYQINFSKLAALIVPGLALGQAVGRFGNYFNQELFGIPSTLPWSIFISPINRPIEYLNTNYFHPTFFYESLACFVLFLILFVLKKYQKNKDDQIIGIYILAYGAIRFFLEYLRIDPTPEILSLRFPQLISLLMFFIGSLFLLKNYQKK